MSILFRTKGWLTIAQLARAWTVEILGAEQDLQQFEQELVHLLLEDMSTSGWTTGPLECPFSCLAMDSAIFRCVS
jgi:hypothetical protein